MLGPSGFFLADGPGNIQSDSDDIELIHSSKDGFNELYRICKNGRFFVYKALKKEYRGNILYEELLKKDFNIGFSLNHSNICQYYAKIEHPLIGSCIVMEWIDGCTLQELMTGNSLDKSLTKKIICELCDAIGYIHRKQVIHRDLKPENILITHNGRNVKVIDFGLSDTDSYSFFKAPAGTRIYASPELAAGEPVDGRSDIWSIGMIINEMSSGYRHVAKHCLKQERDKRYGSAEEVKKAIMNEGARKMRNVICIAAIFLAVAATAFMTYSSHVRTAENGQSHVEESPSDTLHDATTTNKLPDGGKTGSSAQELKSQTNKKSETNHSTEALQDDNIDADGLDALIQEAAQQLL